MSKAEPTGVGNEPTLVSRNQTTARVSPPVGVEESIGPEEVTISAGAAPRRPEVTLPPGRCIGRYIVSEKLGTGGMGVVYAAHDPELDRRIALKLVRAEVDPGRVPGRSDGAARLLREAQAMAKLHHPNVIVVHDVGTVRGQVFIAMEYLDGGTVRSWAAEQPRPWREVVDKYLAAGEGLAAAHDAGIIHRDFKPENVLLGKDGRVCVVDFGLALAAAVDPASDTAEGSSTFEIDSHNLRLTETGAVVGTPAFMAPEQHRGDETDARSDQFSFCVALWEGLYGSRPFKGDSMANLAVNVLEGRMLPPPANTTVPRWVYAVIERGLSVDPAARHPDMHALLAALRDDPAIRRRRTLRAIGVAGVLAAGISIPLVHAMLDGKVCVGANERIAEVWNDDVEARVHAAFVATGREHAERAFARVSTQLDDYARDWAAAHTDACRATHERGEQSEELLDRRMACLERRRRQLGEIADALARADPRTVDAAEELAGQRGSLEECADADALLDRPDLSTARRELGDQLATKIDRLRVLRIAGRRDEATALVDSMAADIEGVDDEFLESEVLYYRGAVLLDTGHVEEAEQVMYDAAHEAGASGNLPFAANAWTALVRIVGLNRGAYRELPPIIKSAEAATARIEDNDWYRATLLSSLGTIDVLRGEAVAGEAKLREALAIMERVKGPDHDDTFESAEMLAVALHGQGKYEETERILTDLVQRVQKLKGPHHPRMGSLLGNLARVQSARGDRESALKTHRRALEVLEASFGPEHPVVTAAHSNIADTLRGLKRYDEAAEHLELALKAERKHGASSQQAATLHSLGRLQQDMEHFDEAAASFREAARLFELELGPDNLNVAYALGALGEVLVADDELEEAEAVLRRALKIREGLTDGRPGELALVRLTLAQALRADGMQLSPERESEIDALLDAAREEWSNMGDDEGVAHVDALRSER